MSTFTPIPDFVETAELKLIPLSRLDLRTDEEIIASLLTPQPIKSQKNIWTFWDTGFWQMRPYVRRNVIGWVRRLGQTWTVRVLDHVPGSPNNVESLLESSWFHSAFNNGTMTGEYVGAHKADLIRLPLLYVYGGIWMDAGTTLFRHVDAICWDAIEDPETPYEISGFVMEGDVMLNGFIATKKGNGFIKRWHDVYLEMWKDRTDCIGLHDHPLVRDVEINLPSDAREALFGHDMGLFHDYVSHFLAFKRVRMLEDPSDNFNGLEYWQRHAYLLSTWETFLHQRILHFNGQRQFDLFSLPREGLLPGDRNQDAESLVNTLLACSSTMKLSHGLKKSKLILLAKLWDLPENEDADIKPGTFAAYLRWGSEHLEQTRVIEPLPVNCTGNMIKAGVTEVV